jgi:hypothetical protein
MLPRDSGDERLDAKRGLRRGRERDAIFFNDRSARPRNDGGLPEESGLGTMFRASAGQGRDERRALSNRPSLNPSAPDRPPFYRAKSPVDTSA